MKRTSLSILLLTFFVSLLSIGCDDDVNKNNNNVNNTNNAVCGNGILETGETCDATDLGGLTCETVEGSDFTGGTLACTAGCALDTAGCTTGCTDECELDNRVCNINTLRVCEANTETGCTEWADTDCTLTSETCQVIDTVAQCAACTDACTLDEERCNGTDDGIEACILGTSGCTEWDNTDCGVATPACELQGGVPTCVSTCTDECTLDAKQCNLAADGIETCITAASGCTEWDNTACDLATPECQDIAGVATCMAPNGSGETCADVYTITVPFYTEGTDFTTDYLVADMTMDGTGCDIGGTADGVDAVFAVDLAMDEAIIFAQGGGLDGVLYIQGVCDSSGECFDAVDDTGSGTESILFAAPADGTYFLIVKSYYDAPSTMTYGIAVFHFEDPAELTCDDGFDNDLDGDIDCEDADCFGVAGICDTETLCGDGLDNDADGDIDCADADCAGVEPCGVENTEARCGDGIDNDDDGLIDCDETDCASFTACQVGNTCSSPLAITTFPFNITGTDFYTDYPVNNLFTYSAGNCGTANGPDAVFSIDLLAGERINMAESGSIDVVVRVLAVCTNTNPTCAFSDDFTELDNLFTAPADGTYFIVLEAYYATDTDIDYNFTVTKIPSTEANCTDGLDEDRDTLIDCNDADCFGETGCTTELNCNDGLDNDDDGDADCDDIDCSAAVNCLGGESCTDALPISVFPYNITGTDITADFANDHTFTGTGCGTANGAEAVFAVTLTTGQRIKLDETGTLDSVIRVINPCDNATTCLLSSDSPEINLVYTAPSDGTYFIVLEAWSATPSSRGYNFTVALVPSTELICNDGLDNDLDTFRDCADSDCAGVGSCGPENTVAFCSDGLDNDGDNLIDCFDANCAGVGACGPENTDALCGDGIDNDADGRTDCGDTDCATFCTVVFTENFNTWPLTGWTIDDGGTVGFTWQSSALGTARTLTGSTGTYAKVDSDAAGSGKTFNDSLVSPAFNCTGYTSVVLSFRHYYNDNSATDFGYVEISTDGGSNWNPTPVATYNADSANGAIANLNISAQAAGQANVAIRFRFVDAGWDWYWLIDDVTVSGN